MTVPPETPNRLERATAAVERHPARFIVTAVMVYLSSVVAAFFFGFEWRMKLLEAGPSELVPKGTYVLKSELGEMLSMQQIKERYIEKVTVERDYVPRNELSAESKPPRPSDRPDISKASHSTRIVFSSRKPFPAGYDMATPGMKFSEAMRLFPGGELRSGSYLVSCLRVGCSDQLFSTILFLPVSHTDADPVISTVALNVVEDGPDALAAALQEFGDQPHRSEVLGSRVVWPNLAGFELAAAPDSYMISQSSKK